MYEFLRKGQIHNLSIMCHVGLFDILAKPVLLYGLGEWGYENIEISERIQTKIWKLLLYGLEKKSSKTLNYRLYKILHNFDNYFFKRYTYKTVEVQDIEPRPKIADDKTHHKNREMFIVIVDE